MNAYVFWLAYWSIGWLVGWSVCWFVGLSVDLVVGWSASHNLLKLNLHAPIGALFYYQGSLINRTYRFPAAKKNNQAYFPRSPNVYPTGERGRGDEAGNKRGGLAQDRPRQGPLC